MALHDDCRAKHNILKAKYHSEKDTIGAKAAIHQYVAADQLLAKECHARHRATILQFRAQYMPAH
jgi:hypothetical protein